jgi:outer membrane receptor protein involved in Fe transport
MLLRALDFYSQQDKKCYGLSLAEEDYKNGDFASAEDNLSKAVECKNTSDYHKLKAEIFIAQDRIQDAKNSIALYINSRTGNYISDDDPQLFKDLFEVVRDSLSSRLIKSLSKKAEDVDLAAATVIVIKESEFSTRGYNDLIDLLSDQPGFDISKIQSAFYANVFQRGFRQENTERTLFMIDGVEENDVWSNVAYISRQYPLSNISAVEIIYGPASTIYGARAFAGAINIITKSAGEQLKQNGQNYKNGPLKFGITAKGLGGSNNSKGGDLNIFGKNKTASFFLTGRIYSTDGANMSSAQFYDYNANDIDGLNYDVNKLLGLNYVNNPTTTTNEVNNMVNHLGLTPSSKNYNYFVGYGSDTLKVNPDSAQSLLNKARQIDKERYLQKINGHQVGYSNQAYNYYIGGKVKFENFEAGFRTWKNHEGFNYYQDLYEAGSNNGNVWAPKNTTFYTIYDKQLKNISFSNNSSYVVHTIDKESDFVSYNSFYGLLTDNSYSNPSMFNLIFPDSLIPQGNDTVKQGWRNAYYYYKARQFRNDFKFNVTYKERLNVVTGLDVRLSQLQGDYQIYKTWAGPDKDDQTKTAYAEELGKADQQISGGNQYNTLDAGLYSQATWRVVDSLFYLTGGGRFDYNRIRTSGGFGLKFNPKIAMVFTVKKVIIKAIYSQGLQNPSSFTKYSTFATRNANPNLKPERIQNLELVLQNRHGSVFHWDVSVFYSIIKDAISSDIDPQFPQKQKNQNIGVYNILGSQANIIYAPKKLPLTVNFNLTYTDAKQVDNTASTSFQEKTIGDIAPLKTNLILNYKWLVSSNELNFNLRTNYVGSKPVGPNTTVASNDGYNHTNTIPGYAVFFGTVTYKNMKFSHVSLQFTVNNILDAKYYSPGPRTANGNYVDSYNGYVSYVPQNRRNYQVILNFNF